MIGTLGPYTSASSRPTVAPMRLSERARFTATVVFPTPPFPLATATRFFTPSMGNLGGCGMDGGGIFEISYANKYDRILLLHVPQPLILNEKGRSVHLQDRGDRPALFAPRSPDRVQ